MKIINQFAGRQWLVSQEDSNINSALTKIPAILNGRCQRCNSLACGSYQQAPVIAVNVWALAERAAINILCAMNKSRISPTL